MAGRITQAQTYGENLVVTRTYRAAMGASWFTMQDVVENAGFLPTEHMLLYHINAGYPFVDDGAELIAPVAGPPTLLFGDGRPRRSARAGPASSRRRRTGCSRPSSTACGPTPTARWRSPSSTRAFSAAPRSASATTTAAMPNYIEWRMMGEGQYAVGIEPCTNGFGRQAVAERGELIVLQPGQRRIYNTRVAILTAAEASALRRSSAASL